MKKVKQCALVAGVRRSEAGLYELTIKMWFKDRRRRDVDNVAKGVGDSLNGTAWADDSQVVKVSAIRMGTDKDNPRAEVSIIPISEAEYLDFLAETCRS